MSAVLVLTGEANDNLALASCQALSRLGLRPVVAGVEGSGALLRASRACARCVAVAADRVEMQAAGGAVVERAAALARERGAEFVFAADIPGSLLAARLREKLPGLGYFPFPEPATIRLLDNKWTFYRFLVELGLPAPRTWLIESPEQARDLPAPLVLKPLDLWAGVGVRVAADAAERDRLLAGGDPHLKPPALAQEFVAGPDVDLSFLAERGRLNAWTVQTRRPDGTIDYIDDDRVVELGRRIAAACGYTGLAHIDMRYDGGGSIKVIECNPRVWASLPLTEGLRVDFIGRGWDMARGKARAEQTVPATGACANLRALLRRRLTGGALSDCETVYLRGLCADPLPFAVRAARRLFAGSAA